MITAVDTNVLVDLLHADPTFGQLSRLALKRCRDQGALTVCEVVWAETATGAGSPADLRRALSNARISFSAMNPDAAELAGGRWRDYRRNGGSRTRLVADFLIGAHALVQADRLLTRDHGFFRAYFPDLVIVDPTVD